MSQSTLINFSKRSAPETSDGTDKDETKHIRKFEPAWLTEFDWVVYEEQTNKMHCSACQKYAELADKSSGDGVQGLRTETLTTHSLLLFFWTSSFMVWISEIHVHIELVHTCPKGQVN